MNPNSISPNALHFKISIKPICILKLRSNFKLSIFKAYSQGEKHPQITQCKYDGTVNSSDAQILNVVSILQNKPNLPDAYKNKY